MEIISYIVTVIMGATLTFGVMQHFQYLRESKLRQELIDMELDLALEKVINQQLRRALQLRDMQCKNLEQFINNSGKSSNSPQFSKEDLSKLLILCHPDKHGGKHLSTEMTAKLIKLRG